MTEEVYKSDLYNQINPTDGSPMEFADKGDMKGQVLSCYDSYTLGEEFSDVGDTVLLGGTIPKGARILGTILKAPNSGCSTGIVSVKVGTTVVRTGSTDGDFGAASVNSFVPYLGSKLTAEGDVSLYVDEVSDDMNGETIEVAVLYSLV